MTYHILFVSNTKKPAKIAQTIFVLEDSFVVGEEGESIISDTKLALLEKMSSVDFIPSIDMLLVSFSVILFLI